MATKSMTLAPLDADEAKYRPRIEAMIAELDGILKGMTRKQARIDKLREHTRGRLAELRALTR